MLFEKNSKIVMTGDSISDCERARPVGEGGGGALGKGYISLVNALIRANYPGLGLRIVNTGVSGNTTRSLLDRWQADVLGLAPDYVTVLIGINDVWRHFDSPERTEIHVSAGEYRDNLRRLAELTLPRTKGMVVLSPYFMEPDTRDPMRRMMDEYRAAAGEVAGEYGLAYVDLQRPFDDYFAFRHPMAVAWDRVHPDLTGHMIIAKAFLAEIGFEWQ